MSLHLLTFTIAAPMLLMAADVWRDKPASQWTAEEAKEVLTDSPWARKVVPIVNRSKNTQRGGRGGSQGRRGGIGIGLPGVGIGLPGGGGRQGGGYPPRNTGRYPPGDPRNPQDRYPDDRYPQDDPRDRYPQDGDQRGGRRPQETPTLTLRWESAQPVQSALLKAKEEDAPSMDEGRYALAVIGLPVGMARDPEMTEKKLKSKGVLKRDGKKFADAVDVRVYERDEQLMVVYFFSRSKEIGQNDHDIQFEAHLGHFEVRERFDPSRMIYEGKLAL